MQTYNQFNQGNVMPLLMNFTTPSTIQDGFVVPHMDYNDIEQISYEMRTIGTRSLKLHVTDTGRRNGTLKFTKTDRANEIDDSKSVR